MSIKNSTLFLNDIVFVDMNTIIVWFKIFLNFEIVNRCLQVKGHAI